MLNKHPAPGSKLPSPARAAAEPPASVLAVAASSGTVVFRGSSLTLLSPQTGATGPRELSESPAVSGRRARARRSQHGARHAAGRGPEDQGATRQTPDWPRPGPAHSRSHSDLSGGRGCGPPPGSRNGKLLSQGRDARNQKTSSPPEPL